jgi:nicotinamidase-related amidase
MKDVKTKKQIGEIKEALFLIDMNVGFCEEGNLADPSIKEIVPNIIPVIRDTLSKGEGFFVVNDKHNKQSVELCRYPEHCMGDQESRTIKELAIYEEYANRMFYKNSTCALFAPGMMDTLLEMKNLERVIIVGCCTDICIQNFALALRNFFDEMNIEADIIVPKDAVETYHIPNVHDRKENNERAYVVMENTGIKLVKTLKKEGLYNE